MHRKEKIAKELLQVSMSNEAQRIFLSLFFSWLFDVSRKHNQHK